MSASPRRRRCWRPPTARPGRRLRPGPAGRAELPRPRLPPGGEPGPAGGQGRGRARGRRRRGPGRAGRAGGGRAVTEALVECVPSFSEGRRPEVVDEVVAAFAGADPGVLVL